jgi:hypothetical protein
MFLRLSVSKAERKEKREENPEARSVERSCRAGCRKVRPEPERKNATSSQKKIARHPLAQCTPMQSGARTKQMESPRDARRRSIGSCEALEALSREQPAGAEKPAVRDRDIPPDERVAKRDLRGTVRKRASREKARLAAPAPPRSPPSSPATRLPQCGMRFHETRSYKKTSAS